MQTASGVKGGGHVALVCGVAAAIGTLLSLAAMIQFGLGLWVMPVAAIICGLAAYLADDIRGVGRGLARAWREGINWRPDRDYWRGFGRVFLSEFMALMSVFLTVFVVGGTICSREICAKGVWCSIVVALSLLIMVLLSASRAFEYATADPKSVKEYQEAARFVAKWLNPIGVAVGIFYLLFRGLVAFIKARRQLVNLLWRAFCYIETERRRVCFSSTLIGVAVGFVSGLGFAPILVATVIGGLVGAAAGYVQYEFIGKRLVQPVVGAVPS